MTIKFMLELGFGLLVVGIGSLRFFNLQYCWIMTRLLSFSVRSGAFDMAVVHFRRLFVAFKGSMVDNRWCMSSQKIEGSCSIHHNVHMT